MDPSESKPSTLAKIGNFFRGNSNKMSVWKQSGEQEDWARKAVDVLIKKLKATPGSWKKLEEALASRSAASECVTIPRSIDGRLQVSNCKALPHVIYCRVWRWPDLQSMNELRAVKSCAFPFNAKVKTGSVCINPYHYDRVEQTNILPPIVVPRQNEFAPGFSKLPTQQMQHLNPFPMMPENVVLDVNGFSLVNSQNSQCSSGQSSPMSTTGNPAICQYPSMDQTTPPPPYQENNGFAQNQSDMMQVYYKEPEYWANVSYYELNNRVGEQFRCNTNSYSLVIDGFTEPSHKNTNRFCLGLLSNVNRNSTIESTRRCIGKGITITYANNELFLECYSDCPVFVQSRMTNYLQNFTQETVVKVMPKFHLKIFDYNEFAKLLNQVVNSGFEATYKLVKMCTIRISFVKGFGGEYYRQDITSTPCWIEIHLDGPLKWLDEVLTQMGSPMCNTTSV